MIMPGQFKTRRGASGRLERIPESEQAELQAAAEPDPTMGDFIKEVPAEPLPDIQRRPPVIPQEAATPPPKPPPKAVAEPAVEKGGPSVAVGAAAGAAAGGAVGAVLGTAASFLISKASETAPVGSLETGTGADTGAGPRTLQAILDVLKQTARTGTPIKGAVTTTAAGSKL